MNMRKSILFIEGLLFLGIAFFAVNYLSSFSSEEQNTHDVIPYSKEALTKVVGSVTINNTEKTYKGFTLYPVSGTAEVVLLNMKGDVVHSWNIDAERARLLPNGNLLVLHGTKWGKDVAPWKELRNEIREYAWDGSVVWRHVAKDVAHHDLQRLENGNTVFLRRTFVPAEYKKNITDAAKRSMRVRGDSIIEINKDGETVWEWHAHEHLDLNSCGRRVCREMNTEDSMANKDRDWTHANTITIIPENKWYDNGDSRFKPGNLIFLPRNWWTVLIIDKDSGRPVWEYGGDYRGGISGGHEASMIPKGLPGAGNIIVLDNGAKVHVGESFILEVNPLTKEEEWIFDIGKEFWTGTRGSVQRLPNGNTLITEDNTGRVIEVTREKEIVWEYKTNEQSSRASRYSLDHCPQFEKL